MRAVPLRVTAHMRSPVIGYDTHGGCLDGPLSWAWAQRATHRGVDLPPITPDHVADMPLPLATHGDTRTATGWGWRVSRAHLDIARYTAVEQRRSPATDAMAQYTTTRKHHMGLGPHKARDSRASAVWARSMWWDLDCTDTGDLADLLSHITHLGAKHSSGFGHVAYWTVAPGLPGGWEDRQITPGHAIRAPYWHPTRKPRAAHV